jgi:sugar/nucleoside kinase (ribokinase family)
MSKICDAIVAGHICLDIIPSISRGGFAFAPGQLVEVGEAILSTGGPVSNTGLALHKLGISTRLMGKVGTDTFGKSICGIIAGHHAELTKGMIEVPGEVSSYSIILNPPDADRMFLHCPGCNETFGAVDVDYEMLAEGRLFHFGYPPLLRRTIESDGAELVEILRRAKSRGITTSLDLCMPDPRGFSGSVNWPRVLSAALPYVDIFLPSLEETLFTLYPAKFRDLYRRPQAFSDAGLLELLGSIGSDLLAQGPAVAGLKLGESGLYLRTGGRQAWSQAGKARPGDLEPWLNRELWSPCFYAKVVGTTGAGDATIAGFLAALLRNCSPEECAAMACAVGACSVEAADAIGGLADWDATAGRIKAGWQRKSPEWPMEGWQLLQAHGVWLGTRDRKA